jgi:hypothetical protein
VDTTLSIVLLGDARHVRVESVALREIGAATQAANAGFQAGKDER